VINFSRYAVYYSPSEGSALFKFGASWLGWDTIKAKKVARPIFENLSFEITEITEFQSRYGFHGTLKPPFALVKNRSLFELKHALSKLVGTIRQFEIPEMSLKVVDGFVALVPKVKNDRIGFLANKCVEYLDNFRELESIEEIEKRRAVELSSSQEYNLKKWGYPYVMNDFKFHLTLSGKLKLEVANAVIEFLNSELQCVLNSPFPVDAICLFGERASDQKFQLIKRFPLAD